MIILPLKSPKISQALSNVSTIEASNVTNEVTVSGKDKDNINIDGKNNGNIFGVGSEFIIGNDVIDDFTEEDIIEIAEGKNSSASLKGTDSLTVKNAKDKALNLINSFNSSSNITTEHDENIFNSKESVSVSGNAGDNFGYDSWRQR